MSADVFLGTTSRIWSRGTGQPTSVVGTSTGGKVALGGMALGTAIGLALVTSPWWSGMLAPRRRYYTHADYTGVELPRRRRRGT